MSEQELKQLGNTLWSIANELRGSMNADDFRDYMLSFIFLRYLSDNYEKMAKEILKKDYVPIEDDEEPTDEKEKEKLKDKKVLTPLVVWYENNENNIAKFESKMKTRMHYIMKPTYMWSYIIKLAKNQNNTLLSNLKDSFDYIENNSFGSSFAGLFSEINLNSEKLGKNYDERNRNLCKIIKKISDGIASFSTDTDILGDAYEYLIGQFAAGGGKSAGEFYTPQQISTILSKIVILDPQDPTTGQREKLESIFDFACGSGSLLLNVKKQLGSHNIGKIYGQEKNITTYNLARMNMLLHGVKDTEVDIFHGDSLLNEWELLKTDNPSKKKYFDVVVANPPFSLRWEANEKMGSDVRFKSYGLAPKSAADFAFLLHGFNYLSENGVMAIILPHGVLFRGGSEEKIRKKLLEDANIDTIIGLPSNLFYSTGIPVCILVLKKCKRYDDILFINASEYFEKNKKQNRLTDEHINKIVDTYKHRKEESRYSRRVTLDEIKENEYNLNISRYISNAVEEEQLDIQEINKNLLHVEEEIKKYTKEHNKFLKELGLDLL